ncbi:hypothetical protein [Sphaerochaeta sp. PS]|uniref:hypothetical protein n=1 Tax=Sphaerochaeta sp. PS TaxID=3076336 RepID=UPI0028A40EF9|nr:hypothetical protein [Sphaerochaeta sp. PS]MDT4761094.1 hypothetical protein [Sphaerochaeta sp. PS]
MKKSIVLKSIAVMALLALLAVPLFAGNTGSGNLKLTVAGPLSLEAKLEGGYTLKIPMLAGEGPLFSDNNLKVKALVGVSPVAATFSLDAVLTPIAVAEISLGGAVGTGWDFDAMEISGLTVGTPLVADPLGGAYYKIRTGAALQFDTAAILPGDWTSILLRTYHELNYQGYTNAGKDVPWDYETGGSKTNGFNYKGEYLIGYKMPLKVNLVALQLETYMFDLFSGETMPFLYDVGLIGNLELASSLNLTMAVQFTNMEKDSNKVIVERSFTFKRVALMLNYSF